MDGMSTITSNSKPNTEKAGKYSVTAFRSARRAWATGNQAAFQIRSQWHQAYAELYLHLGDGGVIH
jgi:hypothetical protein